MTLNQISMTKHVVKSRGINDSGLSLSYCCYGNQTLQLRCVHSQRGKKTKLRRDYESVYWLIF